MESENKRSQTERPELKLVFGSGLKFEWCNNWPPYGKAVVHILWYLAPLQCFFRRDMPQNHKSKKKITPQAIFNVIIAQKEGFFCAED